MTLLLVCLLSAAYMAGLSWCISVVHYPLLAAVGAERFADYHAAHTRLITYVVLPPMVTELGTSAALVAFRPDGVSLAAAVVSLALAVGTFAATGLLSVPDHERLSEGFDASVHRHLVRGHHLRTALWSAHAVLLAGMVAAAA